MGSYIPKVYSIEKQIEEEGKGEGEEGKATIITINNYSSSNM